MRKDRTMKETRELSNLLVIFAVVLLCFCAVATACPDPECDDDCYSWNEEEEEECVWVCGSGDCCDDTCYDPETERCCNPSGDDNGYACDDEDTCCLASSDCCDPTICESCIEGLCEYKCDPCESCCDGVCYDPETDVCCNDIPGDDNGYRCQSGEQCCDGECYDPETERCCNDIAGDDNGYICDPCESCCDGECIDDTEKCCDDGVGPDSDYECASDETCCEGNCCDPDCELCCDGTCCDVSNCEICKNDTCVRAVPTNMNQIYVEDMGNGTLYFEYEWNSTTGDLADLTNCKVREKVDYQGGNPYYWPSPPWTNSVPNPTILPVPPISATHGFLADIHIPGSFTTPYQAASFSANQVYQYHCDPSCCMTQGVYVTLLNIGSIFRAVTEGEGDVWRYSITKSGAYAEILPLP